MGIKGYKAFIENDGVNPYTKEAFYEDYFQQKQDEEKEAILRYCMTGETLEKLRNVRLVNPHLYYTARDVIIKLYRNNPSRFGNHNVNINVYRYIMETISRLNDKERQKEWINKYARRVLD